MDSCVDRSTAISTRVRLFRLFLLIPCWESQRLIPKRSAGPRATKIGVVSLKALDHHRPNREARARCCARPPSTSCSSLPPKRYGEVPELWPDFPAENRGWFLDSPWPRNHRSSSFPEARLPSNPKSAPRSPIRPRQPRSHAGERGSRPGPIRSWTAEPPEGRQLGSRQTRQAVLALVNTGLFSPGRVSMESDRAPRCWFSQVPQFRPTAKI